jgi:hypothetical protein
MEHDKVTDTSSIRADIKHITEQLESLNNTVLKLRTTLNILEKSMYINCDHEWILDLESCNEHPRYMCKICGSPKSYT